MIFRLSSEKGVCRNIILEDSTIRHTDCPSWKNSLVILLAIEHTHLDLERFLCLVVYRLSIASQKSLRLCSKIYCQCWKSIAYITYVTCIIDFQQCQWILEYSLRNLFVQQHEASYRRAVAFRVPLKTVEKSRDRILLIPSSERLAKRGCARSRVFSRLTGISFRIFAVRSKHFRAIVIRLEQPTYN